MTLLPLPIFQLPASSPTMAGDELMVEVEQEVARGPASGGVVPWVEKYRPATIDELQQQDQVCSSALLSSGRARRMRCAESSSHFMLLYGSRWCRRSKTPSRREM